MWRSNVFGLALTLDLWNVRKLPDGARPSLLKDTRNQALGRLGTERVSGNGGGNLRRDGAQQRNYVRIARGCGSENRRGAVVAASSDIDYKTADARAAKARLQRV